MSTTPTRFVAHRRRLIDQVTIRPLTENAPSGIAFIGNLIGLVRAAGKDGDTHGATLPR